MITIAHSFTRVAAATLFVVVGLLGTPVRLAAQDAARGTWLASTETAGANRQVGRLILRDGVLSFNTSNGEWQIAASDIKRAFVEDEQVIVERVAGETFRMTIYDARMMVDSPRDVAKIIQKALRSATARRE